MTLEKILFVPDCHHPYVDQKAWKLMTKVGKALRPDTICVLGDFGDFYATSRHPKNPNRANNLEFEVDACNTGLDELDELGAKNKIFCAGNHEDNLSRHLAEHSPQLFNMVKVEKLFRLKERGWKYVPYKQYTRIGKVYVTHDTGLAGPTAHTRSAVKFGSNVVIGHTHVMATNYSTTVTGKGHVAAMFGWLGDRKMAEYMYDVNTTNWSLGFGIGYKEPNGTVHIQPCPIVEYKVVLNGKVYA